MIIDPHALSQWRHLAKFRDTGGLDAVFADNVVLYSPIVDTPVHGRRAAVVFMSAVFKVFFNDSFRYVREIVDKREAVLEFELEMHGVAINGVDILRWNSEGKIVELKAMLRPIQAVNAVQRRLAKSLRPCDQVPGREADDHAPRSYSSG